MLVKLNAFQTKVYYGARYALVSKALECIKVILVATGENDSQTEAYRNLAIHFRIKALK